MQSLRRYSLQLTAIWLLMGIAFFATTAHADGRGSGLKIGFSQVGTESDWRTAFTENILQEAQERGIQLLFSDAENNQENQITALRSFIDQHVDAIILAPVIETGWDQILRQVQAAGIPVVIIDRNVTADESLYLTRVSSDFVREGRLAAAWLAQATAGVCKIVELEGTVGSSAARDRQIGFNEVIALFPGMQIIVSQPGDFMRANGKKVMEGILKTEDPNEICAIWSHNDDMALGAIQAIKEAGLRPGKDILIVSVDAIPDIFKAMLDGDTNATVELSTKMGAPAFDAIVDHLEGKEVPKWIRITGGIFFPETAAQEYEKRKRQSDSQ
ncbi:MAG: ABC transporter substrate-binding protein [Anaerolineae bacterium]|nr:ABC transporter substrate-binding protein [Anaerolineae bacterium]